MRQQNLNITISDDCVAKVNAFRRANAANAAMIMKIDPATQIVEVDRDSTPCSLADLKELLPTTPRFILYSYQMRHDDGRVQYPLCFIFFTPEDANPRHQMVYTAAKPLFCDRFQLGKMMELRDPDDLSEAWLRQNLGRR